MSVLQQGMLLVFTLGVMAVVFMLGKYVLILVFAYLAAGPLYRATSRSSPPHVRLDGKTAIVTGASAGLGKATARDLARRGARVVMACRNLAKAKPIADDIIAKTGNHNVVVLHLDVSEFDSVRKFAAQINAQEEAVHLLINNAGIAGLKTRQLTRDGHELTFATNHYGPFLLTILLLKKLKASAPSRVINVSSVYHGYSQLDLNDLTFEKRWYHFLRAYCQSKQANVLFTRELARRLTGTGVVTNAVHPGLVSTDILEQPNMDILSYSGYISDFVARDEDLGAQTQLYLAVSEEGGKVSGEYYTNCQRSATYGDANNMQMARELWDVSCGAVGLAPADIPDFVREEM